MSPNKKGDEDEGQEMSERSNAVTFSFFLTDGCDIAPVVSAIECLRVANLLLGKDEAFLWSVLSETGAEVTSPSGLRLAADGGLCSLKSDGNLFLNPGPNLSDTLSQALSQRLHSAKGGTKDARAACRSCSGRKSAGALHYVPDTLSDR